MCEERCDHVGEADEAERRDEGDFWAVYGYDFYAANGFRLRKFSKEEGRQPIDWSKVTLEDIRLNHPGVTTFLYAYLPREVLSVVLLDIYARSTGRGDIASLVLGDAFKQLVQSAVGGAGACI